MLKVDNLTVNYGAIEAVKQVSFNVNQGEIVTLIGANGAGKSTILKTLSGVKKAASGQITFLDTDLTKLSPSKIVQAKIAQVPEGRRIFAGLTVRENLQMGGFLESKKDKQAQLDYIFEEFPILAERQGQDAATLSGGEQQMLAMGRALMSQPKLLLLDEPSMGLSPIFIEKTFAIIQKLNEQGTTILLIEQNAKTALKIADRGYVLANGKIKLEGTGEELLNNEAVQHTYLGMM